MLHFRPVFLPLLLLCTCGPASPPPEPVASQRPPNILLLLADDLGYGELGSYGQATITTPVLDSLARSGLRFTTFYAGNPVCAASRAVLMSGMSSAINSVRGNMGLAPDGSQHRIPLPKTDLTLAEMLRADGYQTAMFGKWHLDVSYDTSTWAYARGFDQAVQEQWSRPKDPGPVYDGPMEYINGLQDSIRYDFQRYDSQDQFRTDLALDYLERQWDTTRPLFLYMSYRAPHAHEWEIGNETLYAGRGWPEPERRHAAQITLLDRQVGRLLEYLRTTGQLDNTLVLFTSDNGPHREGGHDPGVFTSSGHLRGHKRDMYEGGIRVPLIAYWPGHIEAGTVTDQIASFQDIMPTLAAVAGTPVPAQSDGVSFLPLLLGETLPARDTLRWEFHRVGNNPYNFRQAVRIENFKGVRYGAGSKTELYDLSKDVAEAHDIAAERPELVAEMERIFREQRREVPGFPYGGSLK